MNLLYSLLLGMLQGLTEFIPVSSSGHLVLAQSLIPGFVQPGVLFDVFVHAGTLFSVLAYFNKRLIRLFQKHLVALIAGSIPAAFAGLFFQNVIESFFVSSTLVGAALIVTGIMNYFTDAKEGKMKSISLKASFLIGVFQAFALIPGISRSGSTIFSASSFGIEKRKAAEFSFLLSIPAVIGANLLQFISHTGAGMLDFSFYLTGFLAAFISGYFAIKIMMRFLVRQQFKVFAFYCFVIGILVVLF